MTFFYNISFFLNKAIDDGRLFVLYLPDMNNVQSQPDLLEKPGDNRVMRDLKSQITFFVLKNNGKLAVVAIQTDHTKSENIS